MLQENGWQTWTRDDWNRALFRHFFVSSDFDDGPVTRIVLTAVELSRVASAPLEDSENVESSFLRAVRTRPQTFNNRLQDYCSQPAGRITSSEPPSYFILLLFTCYVASLSEDRLKEQDFRDRLNQLLGFPSEPHQNLTYLSTLWERFADALNQAAASNEALRPLILPDQGRFTRIGYSLKLPFPPRRDQRILGRILGNKGFSSEPPVAEILKLLFAYSEDLSDVFRQELYSFHQAFLHGGQNVIHSPLWSVIRDTIRNASSNQTDGSEKSIPSVMLFGERDYGDSNGFLLYLLTTSEKLPTSRGVQVVEADLDPEAKCKWLLFHGVEPFTGEGVDFVVQSLFDGDLCTFVPSVQGAPLQVAAKQGFVLMQCDETFRFRVCYTLPEKAEGEIIALVHRRLVPLFQHAIGKEIRVAKCSIEGWTVFCGFDAADLSQIDFGQYPGLQTIRALQKSLPRSLLHLEGGVRIQNNYLGYRESLPRVRVPHGSRLLAQFSGDTRQDVVEFVRPVDASSMFDWPTIIPGRRFPISGCVMLHAQSVQSDEPVARRRLNIISGCHSIRFKECQRPNEWVGEPLLDDWNAQNLPPNGQGLPDLLNAVSWRALLSEGATSDCLLNWSDGSFNEQGERIEAFSEICSAISTNRAGIPENEFLELIKNILLPADATAHLWSAARSLVESGCFDCRTNLRWRTRRYFANSPELVYQRHGEAYRTTITGLVPKFLRQRWREYLEKSSISMFEGGPLSLSIQPLPYGICTNLFEVERAAASLGLRVTQLKTPDLAAWDLGNLLRFGLPDEPLGYETAGVWDWALSKFHDRDVVHPVQIFWRRRSPHPDRPDYFSVTHKGRRVFTTYSRNCALLVGHSLARKGVFAVSAEGSVYIPPSMPQLFLPLAMVRPSFATAGAALGLMKTASGYVYSYPIAPTGLLPRLFAQKSSADNELMNNWLLRYAGRAHEVRAVAGESRFQVIQDENRARTSSRIAHLASRSAFIAALRKFSR